MYSDKWRSNGSCDVHGAAITTDKQVRSFQESDKLGQACFTGPIDGSLLHLACYAFVEWFIVSRHLILPICQPICQRRLPLYRSRAHVNDPTSYIYFSSFLFVSRLWVGARYLGRR